MRDSELADKQKVTFQDAPARLAYAFEDIGENGGIGGALVWVFQALRAGEPIEANVNAIMGEVLWLVGVFIDSCSGPPKLWRRESVNLANRHV